MSVEQQIDELYLLPVERFIAARDDLVKQLVDEDRPAAAEVKALRKPSLIAWALNQLAHRNSSEVAALIQSGNDVRQAQRRAVSGGGGAAFRAAIQHRRALVQQLTRRGLELLAEAGRAPQSAEEEIGRTLEAASSDAESGEALRQGRLTKPITSASGFDSVGGLELLEGGASGEDTDAARTAKEIAVANAEREAEKARAVANRAEMRVRNLEDQAREATRRLAEARTEAKRRTEEAEEAEARLQKVRPPTS